MLTTETRTPLDLTYIRSPIPLTLPNHQLPPRRIPRRPRRKTQVPQRVIDAISNYLRRDNANTGGAYATSRHTDSMLAEARAAMADFLNCAADEIVFGPNMTTLTYALSRSFGREFGGRDFGAGDEILVTRLDHDANVSPWLALEEKGATIRWAEIHQEDCTLNLDDLASKINPRTRLVAIGYASNAVGTINPVKKIVSLAHAAGALAYVDAVHYGPHGLIDVADLGLRFPRLLDLQILRPAHGRPLPASASTCSVCIPTKFVPSPTPSPTAGSGARSTTNASPASPPA